MADEETGRRRTSARLLGRYGPLIGVVAVIAAVAGVLAFTGDGDDPGDSPEPEVLSETGEAGAASVDDDVVSWDDATGAGIVEQIDWGERCDTETGRLKLPTNRRMQCYKPFEGDNGGPTETGVTADTIKIVLYWPNDDDELFRYAFDLVGIDDTIGEIEATTRNYIRIFEEYAETYGRTVELIRVASSGNYLDVVAAQADAEAIATEIEPFVVVGGNLLDSTFAEVLAQHEIMCVLCSPTRPDDWFAERVPYVLTPFATPDQRLQVVAEYVCDRLAGDTAIHAGDSAYHDQQRQFGYIRVDTGPESQASEDRFTERLAGCDVEFAEIVSYDDPLTLAAVARDIITKFKDAGVTTIVFGGDTLAPPVLTSAATDQDYSPEWVITGVILTDTTVFARTFDPAQWAHAFGISTLPARLPVEEQAAYEIHEWACGAGPAADDITAMIYPSIYLLFTALQAMGPDLTHEGFFDTLFTVPVVEGSLLSPQISYGDRGIWDDFDLGGFDDFTEIWWDADATGQDETGTDGQGMYRYVDGGKRHLPGEWPDTPPKVFDDEGAVAIYDTPPEGFELPDYPAPDGVECVEPG